MLTTLTLTTNRDRKRLLRCLIEEVHGTVKRVVDMNALRRRSPRPWAPVTVT